MFGKDEDVVHYTFINSRIFAGIGMICFAYVCHHSSFIIYNSMNTPRTMERWGSVVHTSVGAAIISSFMISIPSYSAFSKDMDANVLNNFSTDFGMITFARVLLAVTMVLTFPMEHYVARYDFYFFTLPVKT